MYRLSHLSIGWSVSFCCNQLFTIGLLSVCPKGPEAAKSETEAAEAATAKILIIHCKTYELYTHHFEVMDLFEPIFLTASRSRTSAKYPHTLFRIVWASEWVAIHSAGSISSFKTRLNTHLELRRVLKFAAKCSHEIELRLINQFMELI